MSRSKKTAAPPAPAETPAAAPAPVVNTAVTRVIELDPEDFVWATWRKREVLKRPQPAAFDFEACRARLAKLKKNNYGWINWDAAEIAPILSPKEAHFWFLAMTEKLDKLVPSEIADK